MVNAIWPDLGYPLGSEFVDSMKNDFGRILEHCFTILGSVSLDDIYAQFDGPEKVICRSLFSWVNAGSHNAHDDAYVTPSDAMIESQLRVFRAIFERTGHIAHYNMMMGEGLAEAPASV